MNRLIIIGAGGHGRVVADIASLRGYTDIVFLDADASKACCGPWPVVGTDDMAGSMDGDLFVAIGSAQHRSALMQRFSGRRFPTLIHPAATVAAGVEIGDGTVVMAGAVINPGAGIGRGVIINTSSSVDHDCAVHDYAHITVGAHLCGSVTVGEGTWVGAGAIVSNNLSICAGCTLGAGTVVVRSIAQPGTYIGVPARKIK